MDICPNIFANDTGTGTVNSIATVFDPFETYTFHCITHYLLVAINAVSANYFCEASGAWNPTFTPCSGRQTLKRILDQNNRLLSESSSSFSNLFRNSHLDKRHCHWSQHRQNTLNRPILAGSIAIYTCDPGFTLIGSNTSTCKARNGTWSTPEPSCSCKQQFIFNYARLIIITYFQTSGHLPEHFC